MLPTPKLAHRAQVLFVIAKTWRQPRCPSVGEGMDTLWSILTMECNSVLKRNEPSSKPSRGMGAGGGGDLKYTLLRSQSEKATRYIIPAKWHSRNGKTMESVKRSVVARHLQRLRGEQAEYREFLDQWIDSMWCHNGRYTLLDIFLNPQNLQLWKATLM